MDRCTRFPPKTGKRRNLRSGSPCQVKLAENLRAGFLCHHRVSADAGRAARKRRMAREERQRSQDPVVEVSVEPGFFERGHIPNAQNVVWHRPRRSRPARHRNARGRAGTDQLLLGILSVGLPAMHTRFVRQERTQAPAPRCSRAAVRLGQADFRMRYGRTTVRGHRWRCHGSESGALRQFASRRSRPYLADHPRYCRTRMPASTERNPRPPELRRPT